MKVLKGGQFLYSYDKNLMAYFLLHSLYTFLLEIVTHCGP